jgi:hypothetical protein
MIGGSPLRAVKVILDEQGEIIEEGLEPNARD